MESSNLKTKKFWSKSVGARLYRKFAGKHFIKMHKRVAEVILERKVMSVLDIACGPGDFLAYLKERNPNIQITGTDIAPGMIEYTQKRLGEKAKIVEAGAHNQPFKNENFDSVTVMMAFHHFPDQIKSLKEIQRILKKDGRCFIADVVAGSDFQKKIWNFLEKMTGVRGHTAHYTESDFKRFSEEAGYRQITSELIPGMAKRYKLFSMEK